MAIATWELDRTDHRHPAVGCGARPAPRRRTPARSTGTGGAAAPARRPAPLPRPDQRAATRPGRGVQVRRRAAGLALLVIAVVVIALALPGAGAADAAQDGALAGGAALVVGPGETVWGLVAPHAPAGADVQSYVAAVLSANGLDATAVTPGTVVRLP